VREVIGGEADMPDNDWALIYMITNSLVISTVIITVIAQFWGNTTFHPLCISNSIAENLKKLKHLL
jgi:hypothetical protein